MLSICTYAQTTSKHESLSTGYYIVVAAYRPGQEALAKNYTDRLNKEGSHSKYGYDAPRDYLYVYLNSYTDFDESIKQMLKIRQENGFEQAWVRVIKNDSDLSGNVAVQEPEPAEKVEKPTSQPVIQKETPTVVAEPVATPSANTVISSGIVEVKEPEESKKTDEPEKPKGSMTLANTKVIFRFFNPTNNTELD